MDDKLVTEEYNFENNLIDEPVDLLTKFHKHRDKILFIFVIIVYIIMTICLICYYCFNIHLEDVPILYRFFKGPYF